MDQSSKEVNGWAQSAETRVSTSEFNKSFGEIIDRASDGERIVITRFDRDRVVMLAKRDYDRLLELAGIAPAAA